MERNGIRGRLSRIAAPAPLHPGYNDNLFVLNQDGRNAVAAMAVDEAQKRGEQLSLLLQFARADLCGHRLGVSALQPNRALKFLVLPFRLGLRLAADAEKRAAAPAANIGFFLDERRIELGPLPRRDLDHLHGCPLTLLESTTSKCIKKHCLDSRI